MSARASVRVRARAWAYSGCTSPKDLTLTTVPNPYLAARDVRKMPLLDGACTGAVPFGVSDATNHDKRTVGGRRPLESAAARR